MAKPSRSDRPGTFFITSCTYQSRRIFLVLETAELFLQTLQHYRHAGHFKLHAFVVMPDHIHLLLTPQDRSVERIMVLIKGGFSHRLNSKFPVWQRGFTDRRMRDRKSLKLVASTFIKIQCEQGWQSTPSYTSSRQRIDPQPEKRTSAAKAVSYLQALRHG